MSPTISTLNLGPRAACVLVWPAGQICVLFVRTLVRPAGQAPCLPTPKQRGRVSIDNHWLIGVLGVGIVLDWFDLGLDSTFGGLEAMITGLCDEYPKVLGRHREMFVGLLLVFIYCCSLPTATYVRYQFFFIRPSFLM